MIKLFETLQTHRHKNNETQNRREKPSKIFGIRRWILTSAFLVFSLIIPKIAQAGSNPLDMIGFGPRYTAMGGCGAAIADDPSSLYYNPAGLTVAKEVQLMFLFLFTNTDLSVDYDNESGPKLPDISNLYAIGTGSSIPVGGIFRRKMALGFGLYLPLDKVVTVGSVSVNDPNFYMYHDFGQRTALYGAIAYEIFPELSIGVGTEILASANGPASIVISADPLVITSRRLEFDVFGRFAPNIGIRFQPITPLIFGLSYRGEMSLDFSLPIDITIPGEGGVNVVFDATDNSARTFFTPHQITFGAAYHPFNRLLVSTDITWMDWSSASDPSVMLDVFIDGSFIVGAEEQDLNFHDIFVPKVGLEFIANDLLTLRGGYQFQSSPVPDQNNPETNLVDPEKHILSLGSAINFQDVFCWAPIPLTIDLAFQYQLLAHRKTVKTDPEDPLGSYTGEGEVFSMTMGAKTHF